MNKNSIITISIIFLALAFCGTVSASETVEISVNATGNPSNGNNLNPSISDDGQYTTFESTASNLVTGDNNGDRDIFVHDINNNETVLVSVSSSGVQGNYESRNPDISGDGRYIVFQSMADNLVSGDNNGYADIFLHDMYTGQTIMISVSSSGIQGDGGSYEPSISADGSYVAFESDASNLVANDHNSNRDVFIHDMLTGETTRVSVDSNGYEAAGYSGRASISANGTYVVFESSASNLVSGDNNGYTDIFIHNTLNGQTTRASINSNGEEADGDNSYATVSGDGSKIAFRSYATNLVSNDNNGYTDIFIHNTNSGDTIRVSVDSSGQEANNHNDYPDISPDGSFIVFRSQATNLVSDDTNGKMDIFTHELSTGETIRVSINSSGIQANGDSISASISTNGMVTSFSSAATNLVNNDNNGRYDIFAHITGNGFDGQVYPGESIQDEINSADEGATITVHDDNGSPYTYNENIIVNKTLTINAAGNVTINALDSNSPIITLSNLNNTKIQGFILTGSTNSAGISIIESYNNSIVGNTIINCSLGIENSNSDYTTISNNNISIGSSSYPTGIHILASTGLTISGNTISQNALGISSEFLFNSIIIGNTIINNQYGGIHDGTGGAESYNNIFTNNYISENGQYGISLVSAVNSTISWNSISNSELFGIDMEGGSSYKIYNNTISGILTVGIRNLCSNSEICDNNLTNNANGIYVGWYVSGNTINGNILTNNQYGITVDSSIYNNFTGNYINGSKTGIYFYDSAGGYGGSPNNQLRNNVLENNTYNLRIEGRDDPANYIEDIDSSNTINGKPVYYYVELNNLEIDGTADPYSSGVGFLGLVLCNNITVRNLSLSDNYQGILLAGVNNSNLEYLNITNNGIGIYQFLGSENIISGNILKNTLNGMYFWSSTGTNITSNQINDSNYGIYLMYGSENRIYGNNFFNNHNGIYIDRGSDTEIYGNNLTQETLPNDATGIITNGCGVIQIHNNNISLHHTGIGNTDSITTLISENQLNNNTNGISMDGYNTGCAGSRIIKNTISNGTSGIYAKMSQDVVISENQVLNETNGIDVNWHSSNIKVSANNVINNTNGIIVHSYTDDCEVYGNIATNNSVGIYLGDIVSINSIHDNNVTDCDIGIHLFNVFNSGNNIVSNNNIQNSPTGIRLDESLNNQIINNTILNAEYGIWLDYYWASGSDGNLIHNNNITCTDDAITIINSNWNTVDNNNLINNANGAINLNGSSNNNISNNNITLNTINSTGNWTGILLANSTNCTIQNNNITGSQLNKTWCGITLENNSSNNTLLENTIQNNGGYGILIANSEYGNSEYNQITSNSITGNLVGIVVNSDSSTNIINFNRIVGNTECQLRYTGENNTLNATNNWWGSNTKPTTGAGQQIEGMVNYSPWLYMTLIANPKSIITGATSTITASFNNVYNGTTVTAINPANGHIPDGMDVTFASDSLGSINPLTGKTLNGIITTTYTAGAKLVLGVIMSVFALMDKLIGLPDPSGYLSLILL